MMQKSIILYLLFAAIIASSGCDKEIAFNPQIHRAEAIVDGQPWTATAKAYFNPLLANQSGSDVDDYLAISITHTYPNDIDLETLILHFPHSVFNGCHNVSIRNGSLFIEKSPDQAAYFTLFGSELDAVRELYLPDTARAETSTICITKFSEREQLVEGTFSLHLKIDDDFVTVDDVNRPSVFSIQNGTFSAHLAE